MTLKEKDRVRITWDPEGPIGTVLRVGVEVSEIVFDGGKRVRFVPNEQLVPCVGSILPPTSRRVQYRKR